MNVIKIVVNELPTNCIDCQFHQILDYVGAHHCTGKPRTITHDKHGDLSRPDWCPLQVEEVCEWVLDYHMDDAMWDIAPSCCVGEFSMNKPKYEVCPSCGKRIKYVESEE